MLRTAEKLKKLPRLKPVTSRPLTIFTSKSQWIRKPVVVDVVAVVTVVAVVVNVVGRVRVAVVVGVVVVVSSFINLKLLCVKNVAYQTYFFSVLAK